MGFSVDLFPDDPVEDSFICGVCHDIFDNATNLNACGHTFCKTCVTAVAAADPKCPICRKGFYDESQSNPNFAVNDLIGKMKIRCRNSAATRDEEEKVPAAKRPRTEAGDLQESTNCKGCDWVGKVSDWYNHAANDCQWEETTCPVAGCSHSCARKDMENHTTSSFQQHLELGIEAKVATEVELRVAELRRGFSAQLERFRLQINSGIPIQPPEKVIVSGAGSNEVNGVYKRRAADPRVTPNRVSFIYVRVARSETGRVRYVISPSVLTSGRVFWCICIPDQHQPGTHLDVDFYRVHSGSSAPPPSGWSPVPPSGQLPLPQLEYQF